MTVSAMADDSDGNVSYLELFYSEPGSGSEVSAGMVSNTPYSWTLEALLEGTYGLRVVATDDDNDTAENSRFVDVVAADSGSGDDFAVIATGANSAIFSFKAQPEWPTGGTFYSCKDLEVDCYPAALLDGRWDREHNNLSNGQTYTAQLKVPGMSADNFPRYTFTWNGNGAGNPGDGGNPDEPGDPDFAHLDWTSNSLTNGRVGPAPRANPPAALRTPINGAAPTSHGFAFDINGNQLSWRWGPQIVKGGGDSGLEMHCSDDGNMTFKTVGVSGGSAAIPCSGDYNYFFRYLHPSHSLNNNPAHQWIWTGLFTTEGSRVDPNNYPSFTDGSANWMRFRHPVSHDGTTAAILDAQHNNDLLRNLDRYNIWVDDSPGNVQIGFDVDGNVIRNESMRNTAGGPNGQQFFALTQNPGFGNVFSYGQVIQFEVSAVAGNTGAQTYNDFSYYTVGLGWGNYGDPRLNPAGKASTTMILSDNGTYSHLEYNAIFTQPVTTLHSEDMVDDFLLGHHLFHGIDPNKQGSTDFDEVKIGDRSCGDCHFRDGRGSEIIQTAKGPRLPPPTYGVKLLEVIEGREAGFSWDGSANTVAEQVRNALVLDHGVDPDALPGRVLELLTTYTEVLTVPARNPGSYDLPGVAEGDVLFNDIGCAGCHTPVQTTRSDAPTHLRDLTLRPYTDMKTWDLGEGDFRTPPLWGLGHNIRMLEKNSRALLYMHDGGSTSLEDAIQRHGGDAASVRSSYNSLSGSQQDAVKAFVETL
ncbi:di-heme oxidoredictase family protein [Microbulbifer agarilyticus]